MKINVAQRTKQVEEVLSVVAARGPRHAAYVERYLRPHVAAYLEEYLAKHPAFSLEVPPSTYAASKELVHFILGLDQRPVSSGVQLKWLQPYLAEAAGFTAFARARQYLDRRLTRVYPQLWARLATEMSPPARPLPGPPLPAPALSRPVLTLPYDCGDAVFNTLSVGPNIPRVPIAGGYYYLSNQIELDANDLTLQYLISRHPLPTDLPIPLVLGLDPCFRQHLFAHPQAYYQHSPLQILLHECLHASVSRRREPYRDHFYDGIALAPGWRISEVVHAPLTLHLLLTNGQAETLNSEQPATPSGRLRLSPQSLYDLMEAVTDYLTDARLASFACLLDDQALSQAPVWSAELLTFAPALAQWVFPAQAFLNRLSPEQVASFWNLDDEALEALYTLLRQSFTPGHAAALILWLSLHENVLAAALAEGEVARSPELEELLTAGWKAVARWLNEPAYTSPLSQLWKDL